MTYMRSEARQAQILACAKKVFAERGFHACNVSHICKEAGIGRGTLYQYFDNKKSVFTAILRETLERAQRLMLAHRESLPRPRPRPERLRRDAVIEWTADRLRTMLEVVFEDEQTLRILLREAVGLDVDVEALLSEIDDAMIGAVEEDLRTAMGAGIVRELNPRLTATLMVGGIEKLLLRALRSDDRIDLDALAKEAARLHGVGVLSDRVPEGDDHGSH